MQLRSFCIFGSGAVRVGKSRGSDHAPAWQTGSRTCRHRGAITRNLRATACEKQESISQELATSHGRSFLYFGRLLFPAIQKRMALFPVPSTIIDGGGGRFIRRGSIHSLPSFEAAMRLAGRILTTEHGIYRALLFAIPTTSSILSDLAPTVESTEKSSRRIDHPPPSRTLKEKIHEL